MSKSLLIKALCSLMDMTLVIQHMQLLKLELKTRKKEIKKFLSKKSISRPIKSFSVIKINKIALYVKQ